MNRTILIIEDDQDIADSIAYNLRREGKYRVIISTSGEAGLRLALETPPDLIVLDINLPQTSGFEICRELRSRKETEDLPIILLTARTVEDDKVKGLALGADDYVTKPFGMRELLARIEAVLRRSGAERAVTSVYDDGALRIDYESFEVRRHGERLKLTRKEFMLLKVLVQSRGRVLTRDYLLSNLWDAQYYGDTRTVDVHIRRLRQKLGDERYIETLVGIGYRFNNPRQAPSEEEKTP